MKYDDILQNYVGEFGLYQKRIYFIVCIPAIFAAIFTLLPVFVLITPEHRCRIDSLSNDTLAFQSEAHRRLVHLLIPPADGKWDEDGLSNCYTFEGVGDSNGSVSSANHSKVKVKCDAWVYDKSMHTAVSEFNMVCDSAIYQSHFKMITFLGGLLGAFINGIISDLYGRKRAFMMCLIGFLVVTVILVLSPVYSLFLAMRFFQGMCGIGIFVISFVMVMELVGPSYRMLAGMVIELFWCFGLFGLVGMAYLIPNWKYLIIAVSAPCLGFFSYLCLVPESPRWLLSRGRIEEAEALLKKAAKVNGTDYPQRLLLQEVVQGEEQQEVGRVWKLFTHRVLLVRMLIIIFNRFTLNMAYYGLWLNIASLSGNVYLNFTISSAVETAANLFILLFINRVGRKPLYCGSMLISATVFLLSLLPIYVGSSANNPFSLGMIMVGKFGISAAYSIVIVYLSELVPTSVRNSALGISQCIEVFGGVLSTYIIDMGKLFGGDRHSQAFPLVVFGVFSLVAGLLSLLLPETKDKQLPDSVDEAKKFGLHEEL